MKLRYYHNHCVRSIQNFQVNPREVGYGLGKNSLGEGANMIDFNEKNSNYTDITKCMVCFCHDGNSYNKERFYKYRINTDIGDKNYIRLLEHISGIKYTDDYESTEETEDSVSNN